MFLLTRPSEKQIQKFLDDRGDDDFSYEETGATRSIAPSGYNIDHNRIRLGKGPSDFQKAKAAVRAWKMFDMPWVELFPCEPLIEVGRTVAIVVGHFGFCSLNASRILYLIDEVSDVEPYGFAYGTLTEHSEIGEERFSVEFDCRTEEVWYDLFAFSRPGHLLAKLGFPVSRYLQRAFADDSKRAMLRAVSPTPCRSRSN
jgi:uncharacterized protein (UPF0548 family)